MAVIEHLSRSFKVYGILSIYAVGKGRYPLKIVEEHIVVRRLRIHPLHTVGFLHELFLDVVLYRHLVYEIPEAVYLGIVLISLTERFL